MDSIKREHRIDSSDSARPAATISDVPYHYAQGLKPKPRIIVEVEYTELNESVSRGRDKPMAKVILRTSTYDDGTTVDTPIGEDSAEYQNHLKGVSKLASGASTSTRLRQPARKPSAAKKKA